MIKSTHFVLMTITIVFISFVFATAGPAALTSAVQNTSEEGSSLLGYTQHQGLKVQNVAETIKRLNSRNTQEAVAMIGATSENTGQANSAIQTLKSTNTTASTQASVSATVPSPMADSAIKIENTSIYGTANEKKYQKMLATILSTGQPSSSREAQQATINKIIGQKVNNAQAMTAEQSYVRKAGNIAYTEVRNVVMIKPNLHFDGSVMSIASISNMNGRLYTAKHTDVFGEVAGALPPLVFANQVVTSKPELQ